MRIALVGAGRIGQLHGRLVAEQPGVEIVVTDGQLRLNPGTRVSIKNSQPGKATS